MYRGAFISEVRLNVFAGSSDLPWGAVRVDGVRWKRRSIKLVRNGGTFRKRTKTSKS